MGLLQQQRDGGEEAALGCRDGAIWRCREKPDGRADAGPEQSSAAATQRCGYWDWVWTASKHGTRRRTGATSWLGSGEWSLASGCAEKGDVRVSQGVSCQQNTPVQRTAARRWLSWATNEREQSRVEQSIEVPHIMPAAGNSQLLPRRIGGGVPVGPGKNLGRAGSWQPLSSPEPQTAPIELKLWCCSPTLKLQSPSGLDRRRTGNARRLSTT